MLNILRIVAELRSELELIDVAIRALERFAHSIGVEEGDPYASEQESQQAGTQKGVGPEANHGGKRKPKRPETFFENLSHFGALCLGAHYQRLKSSLNVC